MSRLEDRTINQILLQIIGPMLIICMIGSLVFFFIEVLYRGPHTARLYWVMGLFTVAAVLVSRISIEEGRERAQLFGMALGIATLIACLRLVEFTYAGWTIVGPVVVLALIAIVMWTSARLTWDCTVVDRSRDASSMGLLETVKRRLSRGPAAVSTGNVNAEQSSDNRPSLSNFLLGGGKKNTPGIWAFYFAILAFPVFGIGQWFVQQESKGWIYILFAVYLGSTLGLLMTTSLLGLERYLSQRNLHVPTAVGRNWLIVGSLFVLLVVLSVMLLPRTGGSDTFTHLLAMFSSPDRSSSKLAIGKDGQQHRDDANNKQRDPNGETPDNPGDQGELKQGEPSNRNSQNQQADQERDRQTEPDKKANQQNRQQSATTGKQTGNSMQRMLQSFASGLRWFTWLIGTAALLFLVWMFRNELAKLFGGFSRRKANDQMAAEIAPVANVRLPPFASFRDPFASGKAESMSPPQIANYTLAALEAWGREFDIHRDQETTPHEYARCLASVDSKLSTAAVELAELYGRCAFSGETVSRVELKPLVNLWRAMAQPIAKQHDRLSLAANQ